MEDEKRVIQIDSPVIIVSEDSNGTVMTNILIQNGDTYQKFGLMIADVVRHIANAFQVDERLVWIWVDRERYRPTIQIPEKRMIN